MFDKPSEINSVSGAVLDGATYIVDLNITMENETFDANHVFTTANDSEWAPWLLQEILAGNIAVTPYVAVVEPSEVDVERDRRRFLNITFDNQVFQADQTSQANMHEAALWALKAVEAGAAVDDYQWNSNDTDFQWILADNSLSTMDAHDMVALWAVVSKRNSELHLKARELKNMDPIPLNYTDNSFWQ